MTSLTQRLSDDGQQLSGTEHEHDVFNELYEGVDHTGWLQKAGHINRDFKRRFFILRGTRLSYYEDRAAAARGGKPRGEVIVSRVRHLREKENVELQRDLRARTFFFDTLERKPFIVYADSMREKQAWVRALFSAIHLGTAPRRGAVEDLYRNQVSAAEGGETSSAEGDVWGSIAQGAGMMRQQGFVEARVKLDEALRLVGDAEKALGKGSVARLAAMYEFGKLLCETQEYSAALQRFEAAMGLAPPYVHQQIQLQCAWCTWQIGRSEQAAALYDQVLEDDPLCWQALLDRARMHLGCGNWPAAVADLEVAVGMGQQSAEVLNDRGVCYYELGEYTAALASFGDALRRNSRYQQAYTNRGNCHR